MVHPSSLLPALTGVLCLILAMSVRAEDAGGCPAPGGNAPPAWEAACAAAIEKAKDPAEKGRLHFQRAYFLNERERYEEALADLTAATTLVPHQWMYLHERAYTLIEFGRYKEALANLDESISLNPEGPQNYQERSVVRFHLGDWEGSVADLDKVVMLNPDSVASLLARAHARLWLGQFDLAREDLKAATALSGRHADREARQVKEFAGMLAALTHHSEGDDPAARCAAANDNDAFSQATLIGDCTLAFLKAKTPHDRAEALTLRGIAWLTALNAMRESVMDKAAAVALAPDNPDMHANLGSAYLMRGRARAALQEFDRSLEIQPSYAALAGRADAYYQLGNKPLAFRDAKASFEIKPNVLALWVLGDLAMDREDKDSAKLYWMGAYHLGSRGRAEGQVTQQAVDWKTRWPDRFHDCS